MGVRRGCYQCNKRRIICDGAEPQCLKCIKKGLECSGNGVRYRFNDGVASRGKLRGRTITEYLNPTSSTTKKSQPSKEQDFVRSSRILTNTTVGHSSADEEDGGSSDYSLAVDHSQSPQSIIYPSLEVVNSQTRLLFNHFSNAMAPEMLIIDGQHNGYRNLILPLALNDQLVQQAVSSIAGLHMWRNRPDVCYQADASRAQVIHKLKEASMVPQANKVFTLSTWMTLLVLLLGELALGGDHYIYLLRMLRSMRAHGIHDTSPEIMQFLHRQTDMLTLLAQPFLQDLDIAQISNNEATLENLLYESLENASSGSDQSTVNAVIDAARCCLEMFRDRVLFGEGRDTSQLEHVKQLVSHIHPCVAGGTSLVWIYFIAAAASTTAQDRIFFSSRLLDIYKVTGFANIPAGLSMLENLWKRQSGALWAQLLPTISTTFVM